MSAITLTAELARNLAYDDAPDDCPFKKVADEHIDHSRWAEIRRLIIEHLETGKLYAGDYRTACTDSSEEQPWERDDEAIFVEVVARPKVVTEYVKPGKGLTDEQDFARQVVEDCAEDIDYMGVGERFEDEWAELSPEDFEARQKRVHDLATSAAVTVTFPDVTP